MITLVLSDLHLPNTASPLREAFLRFCAGPARQAQQVFILGDLFEYWIGDDVGLLEYAPEIAALRALSDSGVQVQLQVGNRDFIVGAEFSKATGVRLMADEELHQLAGQATLLMHGDSLCTDDLAYQRWRRFSRRPLAQWLYRRLSVARRRTIAGGLRGDPAKRNKPEAIMDVNALAVEQALRRHGVQRLLHGHTHRPAEHALTVDGQPCLRVVLADWRPGFCEWLRVDAHGWRHESFPA